MASSARVLQILRLASELDDNERDELVRALMGGETFDFGDDDEDWRAELKQRADRVLRGESKGKPLSDSELAELFGLSPRE